MFMLRIVVKILHIPIQIVQFLLLVGLQLANFLESTLLSLIGESPIVHEDYEDENE